MGYIGKEKDAESSLADHGVRKYDSETGRFTAVDPLSEKYYSLTLYQYAANNPISFVDVDGFAIKAASLFEQKIIIQSIEKKYREYVSFDDNGYAVINSMPLKTDKNSNFMALSELVSMKETIEVTQSDICNLRIDKDGTSVNNEKWSWYGYIHIATGIFLPPNNAEECSKDSPTSQTENAQIFITSYTKDLNKGDLVKAICEELYGHALFYFKGKDFQHNYKTGKNGVQKNSDGSKLDNNTELDKQIKSSWKNAGVQ